MGASARTSKAKMIRKSVRKKPRKISKTKNSRTKLSRKRVKQKTPLFPPAVHEFVKRRIVDISGGGLFIAGAGLILAIYSYSPNDPSMNTSTSNGSIINWAGAPGAYAADLLLQTLGLGAWVIALVLSSWGYRIFRRKPISIFNFKIAALLGSTCLAAIAFARIPAYEGWTLGPYLGGSTGAMMFNKITSLIQPVISTDWTHFFTAGVAGLLAFAGFCYALALSRDEWQTGINFAQRVTYFSLSVLQYTAYILQKIVAKGFHREGTIVGIAQKSPPKISSTPATKATEEETKEGSGGKIARKIAKIAPKPEPLIQGNRAIKEKQPSLNLSPAGDWTLPPLDLLYQPDDQNENTLDETALQRNAEILQSVLSDFGVEGDIVAVHPGPVVTLYELEPAPGIKTSRVIGLADDIARSMSAVSVRCAVVPGRNVIGIELPNAKREYIYLREILSSRETEKSDAKVPLLLGKDIGGKPIIADLAKMPHLLIAGTTGSGKSVAINTMIMSLLYSLPPEKLRMIMIDPKMLELSVYDDIPHLLTPVVTEPAEAITALRWVVAEMEERYRSMSKLGVRNIEGYNTRLAEARKKGEVILRKIQTGFDAETGKPVFEEQPLDLTELPYIVVVVDEFADLMLVAGKEVENAVQRLAQMARAAGIHMIMATQRPSVDVITGTIKANFPCRISFQVTSKIDSRTILGEGGAEHLLGEGDMLYMAGGGRIKRVHGPFVSDNEVEEVAQYMRDQGEPEYIDDVTTLCDDDGGVFGNTPFGSNDIDALYQQAVELVIREGKASTSFVQRHLQIGYNRAARIVEQMEKDGVISSANHVGKREILM